MEDKSVQKRRYKRLLFVDRQRIEELLDRGTSTKDIASELGVSVPTIYKEAVRGYSAEKAQRAIGR